MPGNSERRKKVAMKKVVSGEIEECGCGIEDLEPVAVRENRLMSWRRLVGLREEGGDER